MPQTTRLFMASSGTPGGAGREHEVRHQSVKNPAPSMVNTSILGPGLTNWTPLRDRAADWPPCIEWRHPRTEAGPPPSVPGVTRTRSISRSRERDAVCRSRARPG